MALEKWLIHPGETRVIDLEATPKLKVGLVGGQIDVIAHDEPTVRIEVHHVTGKDLRIEVTDEVIEIDHPQLRWDNFLEVFRGFGSSGPQAEISVAVPRSIALNLGVVSASALIAGLESGAKLNTVSGDIVVDGLLGDLTSNAVSGETQVRALTGALSANSVSGDVAVTGNLTKVSVDTMSGSVLIDASGAVNQISINTVSGDSTVRLDEGTPLNYTVRSVSGKVQLNGAMVSGSGVTSVSDSVGELAGSFVDLRANSVSGDVVVLRRGTTANGASVPPAAPMPAAVDDPTDTTDHRIAQVDTFVDRKLHMDGPDPEQPAAPGAPQAPSAPEAPTAPTSPEGPTPASAPTPDSPANGSEAH